MFQHQIQHVLITPMKYYHLYYLPQFPLLSAYLDQLALKLEFVYGDYIHNPEFMDYLETLPALLRLFEFEQANHPFFGKFLLGLPKLISVMGEDID